MPRAYLYWSGVASGKVSVISQVVASTRDMGVAAGSQPWKSPAMWTASSGGVFSGTVTVKVTATSRASAPTLISFDGSERL